MDSWYAVARAIVAARAGIPRPTDTAVISAAFSACSTLSVTVRPPTLAVHSSGVSNGPTRSQTANPMAAATPTAATPTRATPVRNLMGSSVQFACKSALSSIRPLLHGTASIAPVTELRRNSTLLAPDSSRALTTVGPMPSTGSITVTLVPAVM